MEVNNIVLFSEKKEKSQNWVFAWNKQNNLVFCLNFEFLFEFLEILAGNKTKKIKVRKALFFLWEREQPK